MNNRGYSDVLVGLQYGDEGKAKIIDIIAGEYDIIARFNGGANAGHTIKTDQGAIALQQIPSGIFHPGKQLYIGSGCAVNAVKLAAEIRQVASLGIEVLGRLRVSDQATLIQPHHVLIDAATGGTVGTTGNGIGPAYADRAMRMWGERLLHLRVGDALDDPEGALRAMGENARQIATAYGTDTGDLASVLGLLSEAIVVIAPYVERDTMYLQNRVRSGCRVLFEGAQSVMLDVGRGTVPYVTSSYTGAGSPYVGGDVSPDFHRKTIGVAKAVVSRVGNGPFPSEIGGKKSEDYCMDGGGKTHSRQAEAPLDAEQLLGSEDPFEIGIALRKLSGEYGTNSGRPRRIGMLDLAQLRYAADCNGVTDLYINKWDVLSCYARTRKGTIPCVREYRLDGKPIAYFPGTLGPQRRVEPVIEEFPAFADDISAARSLRDLPAPCRALIDSIQDRLGRAITGIGVGPDRGQHIDCAH